MPNLNEDFPKIGDWETFSELHDLQETRKWGVVDHAHRAKFYESRFVAERRREKNWEALPLLTKADLRTGGPFGFLAVPRSELSTYHESSGTTGEPISSYFTSKDWEDVCSRFNRNAVNLTKQDAVLVKTPYSLVTTAHQMHRAAEARGALVIPADNRSSNMPYSKVVRLLKEVPTTVAWCLPTETLLWAASVKNTGLRPALDFPSLRAFLVAGEPLSQAKRKKIEALWGQAKVYQDYGSTETGSLGGECPEGNLHLWADRFLPEVFNPKTEETSRTGRGQLVITTLYRRAMPLVRYLLEDEVEVNEQNCRCGWVLPTVRVFGRASASILGRKILSAELEALVYSLPLECGVLFWRARYDDSILEIELETASGFEAEACEWLKVQIAECLQVKAYVSAVPEGTLVSKKTLTQMNQFLKPRFLFSARESWEGGLSY
jgi:phenylacetate-CoA ligase